MRRRSSAFLFIAFLAAAAPAAAADYQWLVNGSGQAIYENGLRWQNTNNGSIGFVPFQTDRIFFTASGPGIDASSSRTIFQTWVQPGVSTSMRFGSSSFSVSENVYVQNGGLLSLESGTFNVTSFIKLSDPNLGISNGSLDVVNAGTLVNVTQIWTGGNAALPGRVQVLNGGRVVTTSLQHITNLVTTFDNYNISGQGSTLSVGTGLSVSGSSAKLRAADSGRIDAGAAAGTASIHTITLANGAFLGRTINAINVTGYGIYGSTGGTITNNTAASAPSGAVVFNGDLNVRDLNAFAYSNAKPQLNGVLTMGAGTFTTGSGSSVGGLDLLGSSKITGEGRVALGNGGLTGTALSKIEALNGTLEISQNGFSTFNGAIAGNSAIRKTGNGQLTLAGSAANDTFTGTLRVSQGKLALARTTPNTAKGPILLDGGDLRLDQPNQIADTSTITFNNFGFLEVNGVSETIGGLSGNTGAVALFGGSLTVNQAGGTTYGGTLYGFGTLSTSGGLTANGGLEPGANLGHLTINGGLTKTGGLYRWNLGSFTTAGAGTNFDLVTSNGATILGGTSQVEVQFGFAASDPNAGDPFWTTDRQWLILDASAGSLNGVFGGVFNSRWTPGYFYLTSAGNQVFLNWTFAPVPEPSTFFALATVGLGLVGVRRIRRNPSCAS